jgi:hypothetical protein
MTVSKCEHCGKKPKPVRILFKCRCEKQFCKKCLLPEKHMCTFDYKKMGKKQLEKQNPKVEKDKVSNRI